MDDLDRVLDHVEVAQPEEIHLQQADLLDRTHRVLGDDLVLALRLAAVATAGGAAVLGQLQGNDLLQRPVSDHDRGGVDRVVADDPLQPLGDVKDPLRIGLGVIRPFQLLPGLQAFLEGGVAAEDRLGDLLGETIAASVVEAEHASRVARRRPRRHLAEGDYLGNRLAAVFLADVADHPLAPAHREVDVDVGHRFAARVEEALEQQIVGQRVEVGDVERVGDDRARRRAAARADRDAVLLGVADEVPDDQEVGGEAHLLDHPELELEPLDRLGGRRLAVAVAQALGGDPAQHRRGLGAVRRRVARQQQLAELDIDLAALGDLQRRRHSLGPLGKGTLHLLVALEEELVGVEAQLRRLQGRLGLHAEQRSVVVEVLATQVVDVGGADQGPVQLTGEADDSLVCLLLLVDAVLLHLEVDLLGAEGLDQIVEVSAGVGLALFDQTTAEARLQATGEDDHALGVRGEQLHVDVCLAAREAFQEAGRGELDQICEAGVVLRQQGQVVALVFGLLPDRLNVVDKVGLQPGDRLDPVLLTGLVEVDRAVHHAVVGQPQRRLPQLRRPRRHRLDLAGAIQQRVLAVRVEVDGGGRSSRLRRSWQAKQMATAWKSTRSPLSPRLNSR